MLTEKFGAKPSLTWYDTHVTVDNLTQETRINGLTVQDPVAAQYLFGKHVSLKNILKSIARSPRKFLILERPSPRRGASIPGQSNPFSPTISTTMESRSTVLWNTGKTIKRQT